MPSRGPITSPTREHSYKTNALLVGYARPATFGRPKTSTHPRIGGVPMATVTTYLCATPAPDAIDFYRKAFGATERYRWIDDNGRIGHAELEIGDTLLMLSMKPRTTVQFRQRRWAGRRRRSCSTSPMWTKRGSAPSTPALPSTARSARRRTGAAAGCVTPSAFGGTSSSRTPTSNPKISARARRSEPRDGRRYLLFHHPRPRPRPRQALLQSAARLEVRQRPHARRGSLASRRRPRR